MSSSTTGDADERGRLDTPLRVVEFERTTEILLGHLPPPPAVVADIGGGPGRYALWLAERGYNVRHRDLVPTARRPARAPTRLRGALDVAVTAIGDARAARSRPMGSANAVLLLGPLYHLTDRADRPSLCAARGGARRSHLAGSVFAAAISRWAPRLHGGVVSACTSATPRSPTRSRRSSGQDGSPARAARVQRLLPSPGALRAEVRASGLDVVGLVSVEGIAFALSDLGARLSDPRGREVVLDAARALGRVPELLGLGPHLLAIARRPG